MRMRGVGVYVGFGASRPGQSHARSQREKSATPYMTPNERAAQKKYARRPEVSGEDVARRSSGVVPIMISTARIPLPPGSAPTVAIVLPAPQSRPEPIIVPAPPTASEIVEIVAATPTAPPASTIFTSSGGSSSGGTSSAVFETAASPESVTVEPVAPSELVPKTGSGALLAVGGGVAGFFTAGPIGAVVGGAIGYFLGR